MAVSNLIAFFIILVAASTLNRAGVTDIHSAADAASALRPIAGRFAATVFALGIVGTGLLSVPVLAGSTAYAVGEAVHATIGLDRKPREAKLFYGVVVAATLVGFGLDVVGINPMKALIYAAVINGVVAVPIMGLMLWMGRNRRLMGRFVLPLRILIPGWIATAVMLAAVGAMLVT
jgi:Mn2+/Fe2+ NRAMP family transporter